MEGITAAELLIALHIAVAVMLLVILYHVLFIVVNLRKITKSSQNVTRHVEDTVLKPLAIVDNVFNSIAAVLDHKKK